jgi:ribonucleoside-diphosphate reductase alpha chain
MTDEFMLKVTSGTLDHHEQFVWDSIVEGAWRNGEPGIFFIDTTNRLSLHPEWIEATNPCGEVPLRPYEACVLGSINLAAHIKDGIMDLDALRETTYTMVELLDNVIERQDYPIEEIEREQKRYRKIGVGVMGYADALCELGHKYGSPVALALAEQWMSIIQNYSYRASEDLAEERGYYYGWSEGMPKRRNLNVQVIAPTGTISRLAECSFGIEPHFDVDDRGVYLSFIVGGVFEDYNKYHDGPVFKPASQVTLEEHIKTQAAFQQYTDQAVSKTINCPNETTLKEVEQAYIDAWTTGCKGVTILREGSRDEVVIGAVQDGDCVGGVCPV